MLILYKMMHRIMQKVHKISQIGPTGVKYNIHNNVAAACLLLNESFCRRQRLTESRFWIQSCKNNDLNQWFIHYQTFLIMLIVAYYKQTMSRERRGVCLISKQISIITAPQLLWILLWCAHTRILRTLLGLNAKPRSAQQSAALVSCE